MFINSLKTCLFFNKGFLTSRLEWKLLHLLNDINPEYRLLVSNVHILLFYYAPTEAISNSGSSCRLKKIRCDAILPSCTNCSAARIECLVVNTDKRRKKTKITQVKDLQAQLLALEKSLAAARNDSEQLKLQPNALSIASGSNVTLDTITFSTAPAINLDNPSPNNSSKRRRDVVDFGTPLAEEPFTTFVVDPEESVEIDMGQQVT